MKAKIITDNNSLLLGFRLGGVGGELISDKNILLEKFLESSKDDQLALLIFTKSTYEPIKDTVEDFRDSHNSPLIVVLD